MTRNYIPRVNLTEDEWYMLYLVLIEWNTGDIRIIRNKIETFLREMDHPGVRTIGD